MAQLYSMPQKRSHSSVLEASSVASSLQNSSNISESAPSSVPSDGLTLAPPPVKKTLSFAEQCALHQQERAKVAANPLHQRYTASDAHTRARTGSQTLHKAAGLQKPRWNEDLNSPGMRLFGFCAHAFAFVWQLLLSFIAFTGFSSND